MAAPVSKPKLNEFPKMLYRNSGTVLGDQLIVADEAEQAKALAKGWRVGLALD